MAFGEERLSNTALMHSFLLQLSCFSFLSLVLIFPSMCICGLLFNFFFPEMNKKNSLSLLDEAFLIFSFLLFVEMIDTQWEKSVVACFFFFFPFSFFPFFVPLKDECFVLFWQDIVYNEDIYLYYLLCCVWGRA